MASGKLENFQTRVHQWVIECLGPDVAADKRERVHRFLEEALELVQAGGCSQAEAHQLVDYVFGRPAGEIKQELGGTMTTLAALAQTHGLDMRMAGEVELARMWQNKDAIRAKHATKSRSTPLPGFSPCVKCEIPHCCAVTRTCAEAFKGEAGEGVQSGNAGLYAQGRKLLLDGQLLTSKYTWVLDAHLDRAVIYCNDVPVLWVEKHEWEKIRNGSVSAILTVDEEGRNISQLLRVIPHRGEDAPV